MPRICRNFHFALFLYGFWVIYLSMFRSRKKSNTVLSFWSPQIRISAIDLKVSTNKALFDSVIVWFLYRTEYKYFKCSREWGFLGFQMPPNSPRFLNISFFRIFITVFFCRLHKVLLVCNLFSDVS